MTHLAGFDESVFADSANKAGFTAHERAERELRTLHITSPHNVSSLAIDRQGAAIHNLRLGHQSVLVSAETDPLRLVTAKRDTSHTVLPFGPNGLQPQHGASRYADYNLEYAAGNRVVMSTEDRLLGVGHLQTVRLADGALYVNDEVVNMGAEEQGLSTGKHFYFHVPEADLARTYVTDTVHGAMLTARRSDGSVLRGTMADLHKFLIEGEPLICETTSGFLRLDVPGNRGLMISAVAKADGNNVPTQFALWHRPDTDTFSVESLVGVAIDDEGGFHNDGIRLAPGEVLRLQSIVTEC